VFQRELQVFARARGGFRRAAAADIAAHMQRLPKREMFQIQLPIFPRRVTDNGR